jgi:hypothetical protein
MRREVLNHESAKKVKGSLLDTKVALMQTPVGRRMIAFLTLMNADDPERLRQYIAENYTDEALAQESAEPRLEGHQEVIRHTGKLRVHQVVATGEYQVFIIVQGQADKGYYLSQMRIEEDYPHKIIEYGIGPIP